MTSEPIEYHVDEGPDPASPGSSGRQVELDEHFPEPTAAMVVHRTLAMAARTFLLNDLGLGADDGLRHGSSVDALSIAMGPRPLWNQSTAKSLRGTERRADHLERVHQSRVAMRRIRSNLRTFRLLFDPGWGTALRAELAWYGNELGRSRDLDLLAEVIRDCGPEVLETDEVARLLAVVDWRHDEVEAQIAADRAGPRRHRLGEQMMVLWDGPEFKSKASGAATDVLPTMLGRAWRDLRGAGRTARKDPSDVHLHQLRIRLKDLRYGSETLALVEGGSARKTAKAAERLQSQLGDLHDAVFSIGWLEALAREQPELADAAERLVARQREVGAETRKGWKRGLKDVERRWRSLQG
jgi:CHAD domain-containing protein